MRWLWDGQLGPVGSQVEFVRSGWVGQTQAPLVVGLVVAVGGPG